MRRALLAACLSRLLGAARGHGSMYEPPNRASRGNLLLDPACAGVSCLWFTQGTSIGCPNATGDMPLQRGAVPSGAVCAHPAEPTIHDERLLTFNVDGKERPMGIADWTKSHPWRKPGSAPVADPCGLAGGWYTPPKGIAGVAGGDPPPAALMGDSGSALPKLLKQTVWIAGSTAEVAWGIAANHGGGYQYRLCPAGAAQTEECFQKMPLEFVGDTQWIQYGGGRDVNNRTEIPANRVSVGTVPDGSTWTKNPFPACDVYLGGAFDGGVVCNKPQFAPPIPGFFGFGMGACFSSMTPCPPDAFAENWDSSQFGIVDKVRVPDVPPGDYVISFRWDCEQTPQIWNTCGDITIQASGTPSTPFTKGNGCEVCCASVQGMCANCTGCVGNKTGACAYCHASLPFVPVRDRYLSNAACLGFEAPDGGATEWKMPEPEPKAWSPGCPKCWADPDACTPGERA